jgi:hypothetical protein
MNKGDRVIIIGNHPWKSNAGTYICKEEIQITGKTQNLIKLDNGFSCFADDRNIKVIK